MRELEALASGGPGAPGGTPAEGVEVRSIVTTPSAALFARPDLDGGRILVRIVDACDIDLGYWIELTRDTNVGMVETIRIHDTSRGSMTVVPGRPSGPAEAITDVEAFATCP